MQPCTRIYYSSVLLIAEHVSSETPLIINLDICRQPQTYVTPEAAITVFELLMMSGVSLETC
jgi:hypothetical protein